MRTLFKETGALDYCQQKEVTFSEQAKKALEEIPLREEKKEFLRSMADFVIERTF